RAGFSRIGERGMTRSLAQSEQRLEDVHPRLSDADRVDALENAAAIRLEELIVELSLRSLEVDVQRLLHSRWKLGRHLRLRSAQNEWSQRVRQHTPIGVRRAIGASELAQRRERRRCAEHSWIQEFE